MKKLGGGLANKAGRLIFVSILSLFCLQPLGVSVSSPRLVSCFKIAPLTFLTLITQDSSSNKVNVIRAISEIALSSLLFTSTSTVAPKTTSNVNQSRITDQIGERFLNAPQCGIHCKPKPGLCMPKKCNNELSVDLHLVFARQESSVRDHLILLSLDSTVQ